MFLFSFLVLMIDLLRLLHKINILLVIIIIIIIIIILIRASGFDGLETPVYGAAGFAA